MPARSLRFVVIWIKYQPRGAEAPKIGRGEYSVLRHAQNVCWRTPPFPARLIEMAPGGINVGPRRLKRRSPRPRTKVIEKTRGGFGAANESLRFRSRLNIWVVTGRAKSRPSTSLF